MILRTYPNEETEQHEIKQIEYLQASFNLPGTMVDHYPYSLGKVGGNLFEEKFRLELTAVKELDSADSSTSGSGKRLIRVEKGIQRIQAIVPESSSLEEAVIKFKKALEWTIRALNSLMEYRDPYTADHQRRVACLAAAIAREMGLGEEQVEVVRLASTIHDIGKISVPAEILTRPGQISEIEFNMIKCHPQIGSDILRSIEFPFAIEKIICQHHEKFDGSGYPIGLMSEEILLEARILAVADVVEAISSHRPYRLALGVDAALAEISKGKGTLYDAEVVNACLRVFSNSNFDFSDPDCLTISYA